MCSSVRGLFIRTGRPGRAAVFTPRICPGARPPRRTTEKARGPAAPSWGLGGGGAKEPPEPHLLNAPPQCSFPDIGTPRSARCSCSHEPLATLGHVRQTAPCRNRQRCIDAPANAANHDSGQLELVVAGDEHGATGTSRARIAIIHPERLFEALELAAEMARQREPAV